MKKNPNIPNFRQKILPICTFPIIGIWKLKVAIATKAVKNDNKNILEAYEEDDKHVCQVSDLSSL